MVGVLISALVLMYAHVFCAEALPENVLRCVPKDVYKDSAQAGQDFLAMDKRCPRLKMLNALKKYCAKYCAVGQGAMGVCHYRCGDICHHALNLSAFLVGFRLQQWIRACITHWANNASI